MRNKDYLLDQLVRAVVLLDSGLEGKGQLEAGDPSRATFVTVPERDPRFRDGPRGRPLAPTGEAFG